MKNFKTMILATVMLGAGGVAAHAADVSAESYQAMGFYLRADAGWSFLEWSGGDDDGGLAAGAGIGFNINDNMRTDLRLDYGGDYDVAPGVDISVTTLTGNLYFDIPTNTAFSPYVGAGAGYGMVSGGSDGLALALMGGVGVDLTENLVLDVGYRLRHVMRSGADPMEHQITTGLRFEF